MKKITYLCFLIGTFSWVNAQVLNQSANWPNPAWTLTGSYATGPTAFESDPTTTANFAFDDDDALNGHEDNIAAESPVINLTAAFTAGETWLTVTVQYGYRYFANDQLRFEYWDAATSAWVAWGANIPGNSTTATDNFCTTITKTTFTTPTLNIAGFIPTQLTGFKYRISYDDDPAGIDWNYGFCFDSPTIVSAAPPSCPTPTSLAAVQTSNSALLSWTENGSATLYNVEYGANGFTQGTGTLISGVSNSYNLSPLTPNTAYSYYVQAACGGVAGNSTWAGPFNFTTLFAAPANDECSGAIALTVNPDYACASVTAGTVAGATPSNTDVTACTGAEDDDVWFSFVATSASHRIALSNVAGSVTDMAHSLWTGDCSALTLVAGSCSDPNTSSPTGLTIGQTYYVRVYTYTATGGQNTTFNICIGTPPAPPANDECTGATALTVNPDFACGTVTTGTVAGATPSNTDVTACTGGEDDDVWFSFVATDTTHRIVLSNVAGSVTDMAHSLWTGDCAALTLVAGSCSDPNTSNPTGLTIGQTYYVRVYTYTGTGGQDTTFNICIGTTPPPPTNDDCSGATIVTCGSSTNGTTNGTTNENMTVCGISGVTVQNTPGVWYKYVGDGSDVTVTTCSPTITTGDSRIAVYSGSCGSLTCIGGNDDAQASGCATNTLASIVTFNAASGTDYYILVYSYTATPGTNPIDFQLNVSCVAACSPATSNDECATATPVTIGTPVTGSNNSCSSASLDVTYPTCGNQFGTYYDTWYSFDTGSTTDITIALANQTGVAGFALYSGTCGALTMVAGSCTTTGAPVSLTGLASGTYYLRVFSTSPATRGSYDLSITDSLGTGSFDNSSFAYYPNPVKNVLNLSYSQEISNVEVFNLLGQKVISNTINANAAQIDMSNLSQGAYIVTITSNNLVKTIKVIKQ